MRNVTFEGAVQKGVGGVTDAAGKAVQNDKLVGEGVADRAAGAAKDAVSKTQDAVHKATR